MPVILHRRHPSLLDSLLLERENVHGTHPAVFLVQGWGWEDVITKPTLREREGGLQNFIKSRMSCSEKPVQLILKTRSENNFLLTVINSYKL